MSSFEKTALLQGINWCHRLGRVPVIPFFLPATTTAQRKSYDRSISASPCSLLDFQKAEIGGCLLPWHWYKELEASAYYPKGHKDAHSRSLAPCTLCFDTVWFVPNGGSGPRPLLWAFAIPGNVYKSSDLKARGSVLQTEDWQLSSCKENDWLYLFLIHCYLVHMHNSCLILVVISRKYCLSLSQRNSLSRCPLKKKIWIWKKLKISPKGKRREITRAVS